MFESISTVLKSDHFGIEILLGHALIHHELLLKSDHFGIEITPWIKGITDNRILKSDHFGIEIWDLFCEV